MFKFNKLSRKVITAAGFFALVLTVFSSCKVTQQSAYFKTLMAKDTTLQGFVTNNFESKIIVGDRISVAVTSMNGVEDAIFNGAGAVTIGAATAASGSATPGGYTVQADGTVLLHRLGKTAAAGFTRRELAKQIEEKLAPYTKDPLVAINYLNHKITVLGEVERPQVLYLPEEQISLLDALVLSGDVTPNAKRTNVTVIREEGTEKKVKHLNLEDHSIFSSPWYYVKPNDIILVSADSERYVKEEQRRRLQTTLSLVASGVSLLIIILDRITR